MKIAPILILFIINVFIAKAQEIEKKSYSAQKVTALNITVDGLFTEPEWITTSWENQFIQHEPYEG